MIFQKLVQIGVPSKQARIMEDVLRTADDYGVKSHGVDTLPAHLHRIEQGGYNLKPSFRVQRESASFAVVDADNGLGPVSAMRCMDLAMENASKVGIFHVFCNNANTVGPAFVYPLKAAREGFIGAIFSNSPAQMAPFGGKQKMLGTNPFSVVIPNPGSDPIIIDMASSIVAKSKFKEYQQLGKRLPEGWALDSKGSPTTDPSEGIKGFILPMAGFKGYAISLMIDVLAGLLSGAAFLDNVGRFYSSDGKGMNVGFCCVAINPRIVLGDNYSELICEYVRRLRDSERIGEDPIVLPGDDRISFYRKRMHDESDALGD